MSHLVAKLRYMGRQYSAGQYARGGGSQKHYLEDAARDALLKDFDDPYAVMNHIAADVPEHEDDGNA